MDSRSLRNVWRPPTRSTGQQLDTQKALVNQNAALVQADQAAIESAQATLSYTNIVAPIDGRTGIPPGRRRQYRACLGFDRYRHPHPAAPDLGAIQSAAAGAHQVNSAFAKGPLSVEAQRSDNDVVIDRGTLRVVDNQVDQSTGTVKLKAEFPNTDLQLWPGQFVNVRLLIDTLKDVVVIPTGAVQRGPSGTFVYVVKDDNTVDHAADQCAEAGRDADRGGERRDAARARGHHRLRPPRRRRQDHDRQREGAPAAGQGARGRTGQRPDGQRPPGATQGGEPRSGAANNPRPNTPTMNVSSPFIHRPIATSLLGVAVMLGAALGYWWLPVSALPQVDFPTIQVTTQLPGANPDTITALVTAPLERTFGRSPPCRP